MPTLSSRSVAQLLLLTIASGAMGAVRAQQEEHAFDGLRQAGIFAFGGIGFAGTISPGERQYRFLMKLPRQEALAALEKAYTQGDPAAKAYALVGIHKLDPLRFTELENQIKEDTDASVTTAQGCIFDKTTLTEVAREVAQGFYDEQS